MNNNNNINNIVVEDDSSDDENTNALRLAPARNLVHYRTSSVYLLSRRATTIAFTESDDHVMVVVGGTPAEPEISFDTERARNMLLQ